MSKLTSAIKTLLGGLTIGLIIYITIQLTFSCNVGPTFSVSKNDTSLNNVVFTNDGKEYTPEKAAGIWLNPEYGAERGLVRWSKKNLTYSITNTTNRKVPQLIDDVIKVGTDAAGISVTKVSSSGDIEIIIQDQLIKNGRLVNGLTSNSRSGFELQKSIIRLTPESSSRVIWEECLSALGPVGEEDMISVFSKDQTAQEATPKDLWILREGYKIKLRSK